jgi:hypothetical protein
MMTDWRTILGAIIVVVVIASAVLFSQGDALSGFVLFSGGEPTKNISVSASLIMDEVSFNAPADKVIIDVPSQNSEMFIGEQKIDLGDSATIEIENFEGSVTLESTKLSIGGNGEKISVNGVSISQKEGRISFGADDIDFIAVQFENILLPIKTYEKPEGYVYVNEDKYYMKINHEPLTLDRFQGEIQLTTDQIQLEGVTDRVTVTGETTLTVSE